jgi:hypothetical protein
LGVFISDMPKTSTAFLVLLAALTGLSSPLRAGYDPVAVASTSSEEYAREKFGPAAPKPESYLFFQGKFFGGTTRDPNLEHAQFLEIAKTLGENLVRQNYFPTKDQKKADLLIVVHWGVTTTYEDPNKQEGLDRLNSAVAAEQAAAPSMDHSALNQELAIADLERGTEENSISYNSRLLGFRQELAKVENQVTAAASGVTSEEMGLRLLLSEERYFVILMAYDYHTMKKGTRPTLLWSTRFSVRAPGNSFTQALPVMSRVAADYFGRAVDGLKIESPDAPKGKVEIGIPKVVGDGK